MTNRILTLLVATAALLIGSPLLRAAPSATGEIDYTSAYVFRGAQITAASVQPTLTAQWGDVYATAWANRALQPAESSELDLTLGATKGPFDAGVTAYTYPGRGKTTYEPYVGFTRDAKDVKASLYAYQDVTLHVTTFEAKASASAFSFKHASLSFEGAIGTAHGRDVDAYTYWSAGPTLKTTLGRFGVVAGVQYVSSSRDAGLKRDLIVSRVGFSF
jgi:hypothetical protein